MGGLPLISTEVLQVVREAYRKPFTIASNYARASRMGVAEAASLGLITVFVPDDPEHGPYTDHTWRVTPSGLQAILDN